VLFFSQALLVITSAAGPTLESEAMVAALTKDISRTVTVMCKNPQEKKVSIKALTV